MGCTGDCSSCSSSCSEKKDLHVPCNEYSKVKKVIGVVSGKGGVGKSLVTSMLTTAMQVKGNACGILDADITGPSIPKAERDGTSSRRNKNRHQAYVNKPSS